METIPLSPYKAVVDGIKDEGGGVKIIDVMRAMRRVLVPDGVVPTSIPNLRGFMTSLASVGNPWGQEPQDRANWAKDLGVKEFSDGTEVLYFSCCYTSYDPRLKK